MPEDRTKIFSQLPVTRRRFLVSSLAAGFALAVRPVSAQTITTDLDGLAAGEVNIPVTDGAIPAYWASPATGSGLPVVLVVQGNPLAYTNTSRMCVGGWPSWVIWPSRPNCTPARGMSRS